MNYTFFWKDGKKETLAGANLAEAMNKAGYGHGALAAMDFYASGKGYGWKWNKETSQWEQKA